MTPVSRIREARLGDAPNGGASKDMKALAVLLVTLAGLLGCLASTMASAQDSGGASNDSGGSGLSSHPEDPEILLREIKRRRLEREALSNGLQRRSWALPRGKHHPRNREER